jgi:hypothetical protein
MQACDACKHPLLSRFPLFSRHLHSTSFALSQSILAPCVPVSLAFSFCIFSSLPLFQCPPLELILLVVGGGHAARAGTSFICVAARAVANESNTIIPQTSSHSLRSSLLSPFNYIVSDYTALQVFCVRVTCLDCFHACSPSGPLGKWSWPSNGSFIPLSLS